MRFWPRAKALPVLETRKSTRRPKKKKWILVLRGWCLADVPKLREKKMDPEKRRKGRNQRRNKRQAIARRAKEKACHR